jgi:ubiquinone/menaquinone biosynthesis C-methylase UbiE
MSHEATAKTFDTWAAAGLDAEMELEHGDVVRQVQARLDQKPGERILDLGCGNGWATRLLARAAPGASAIGVDVSPAMIERAEALHSNTIRARYEVAAFEALPFGDARFERVFSMEALYYAADLDRALAEIARVLVPGGRVDLVIDYFQESPHTASWTCAMTVKVHWLGTAEWITRLERAGLADVRAERVVDARGPGSEADFAPSHCYADYATWKAIRDAGSLWLTARKSTSG